MTGDELRAARRIIGERLGLGRPLHMSELGRALKLKGRDPGASIRDMEARDEVTGPVETAVRYMLGEDPVASRLPEILDPRTSSRPPAATESLRRAP